jgi:plastocyanin
MMGQFSSLAERRAAALGGLSLVKLLFLGAALVAFGHVAAVALASETHRVSQKNRAFAVKEIVVAAGDVVEFTNDDEFIHQIYAKASDFDFDTDESLPGDTIPITFTKSGVFEVHCHIHPKMILVVTVQ